MARYHKLLLVEGNDDRHVVYALRDRFSIPTNFEVVDCKGIEGLFEQLPVRFKQSDLEAIAVIIDADVNLQGRWDRIKDIFSKYCSNIPNAPSPEGTVLVSDSGIRCSVWIMPNNEVTGMLEDFLKFLIPEDDQVISEVDNLLTTLEGKKIHKYNIIHKPKARIHTWLGVQSDPGTPLGQSITKRYLTVDNKYAGKFASWLGEAFK